MGSKKESVEWRLGKAGDILLTVLFLPTVLAVLVKSSGFNFLPSNEWTSKAGLPALAVGLVSAALPVWLILRTKHETDGVKKGFGLLLAPVAGYFLGKHLVIIAVPMLFALIAGHQVELSFTVVNPYARGDSKCPTPVRVDNVPMIFDEICRVPDDIRRELGPGWRIAVAGRGTSLGVFADSLRRID